MAIRDGLRDRRSFIQMRKVSSLGKRSRLQYLLTLASECSIFVSFFVGQCDSLIRYHRICKLSCRSSSKQTSLPFGKSKRLVMSVNGAIFQRAIVCVPNEQSDAFITEWTQIMQGTSKQLTKRNAIKRKRKKVLEKEKKQVELVA